ncbi:saccharopine dehydrogenase family protein [Ornithinibacillus sp. 4-3]|uniref:Saccharopine dehydrogenase family protein n=1 Tax=Ornithinibacillus sp. 4-3 TaxID=3231488 RepID=A0AB39HQT1_9BACI
MMHVVVLGTGMIGTTVVKELVKSKIIDKVTAVDGVQANLDKCLETVNDVKANGKIASFDNKEAIVDVLQEADIAIACLPHSLSVLANKAAISAGCHLIDLVGSKFSEKVQLSEEAVNQNVLVVPGCGVAPGIVNFLAARGIELLDEADEVVMLCGGIPYNPLPPLWYQIVFRLESVMGLYTRPALAAENGELVQLPALSGKELIQFPDPVGECEAVITDAHSTAYTLKDKVKKLYEKTIRYKGHWEKMSVLAELGFLDEEPINVGGVEVSPKKVSEVILEPQLKGDTEEDITVLRVTAEGLKDGKRKKLEWEMIDVYDKERRITSMAKTTAFPAVIMAEWIAEGKINKLGIVPPEELIVGELFEPFINELKSRGISISFKEDVVSN